MGKHIGKKISRKKIKEFFVGYTIECETKLG
jgi:hypothetical protein